MTHMNRYVSEKEKVFTASKLAAAIVRLKFGNAAGEDDIRSKMLKALIRKGILWRTPVGQIAWKLGKTPNEWKTGVITPIFKKGGRKQCTNYRGRNITA